MKNKDEFLVKNNSNVLFGYRLSNASEALVGVDDDGFSFIVYKTGKVAYRTYICFGIVKKSVSFRVKKSLPKEITALIESNRSIIESLDCDIDNGSYDGSFSKFNFDGKIVTTLNLHPKKHDIEDVKRNNRDYYDEYKDVMRQENDILEIFDAVCLILKKYNIKLSLHNVKLPLSVYFSKYKIGEREYGKQ